MLMTGDIDTATFERIMETLPVEVSFVDADDVVRYFNKNGDRLFPRPKGVIGLKVQNCHPNKSIDKVEDILEGFKKGTLEVAEFWIQLGEQKVYIRYFPVKDAEGKYIGDAEGKYIGCLEVSQDITKIKEIEGEKRLL
jgi:PAS domain S-box-containing protein